MLRGSTTGLRPPFSPTKVSSQYFGIGATLAVARGGQAQGFGLSVRLSSRRNLSRTAVPLRIEKTPTKHLSVVCPEYEMGPLIR